MSLSKEICSKKRKEKKHKLKQQYQFKFSATGLKISVCVVGGRRLLRVRGRGGWLNRGALSHWQACRNPSLGSQLQAPPPPSPDFSMPLPSERRSCSAMFAI